jgi:hypothetical protein
MEDDDAFARAVLSDAFADGGDRAGSLVPEDTRSGMGAGRDFLEVGTADAAGMDADQHFAGANLRDGDGFKADVVDAAVDRSLHGGWDFVHGSFDR